VDVINPMMVSFENSKLFVVVLRPNYLLRFIRGHWESWGIATAPAKQA